MASTKSPFVSIHGKRLGLAPGYMKVDGNPYGPPLNVSPAAAGNTATTAEVSLKSYSLPGGSLSATGHGIYVRAFGTLGGTTAGFKRATLYVGGVSITTGSLTDSAATWLLEARYFKTGASTQRSFTAGQYGSTRLALATTTDTSTDTSDITIAIKATSGSGSASDVLCNGLEVGFL